MVPDPSVTALSGRGKQSFAPAVDLLYRDLEARVHQLRPKEDLAPLEKAYRYAALHHAEQTRLSGEPYIVHPLAVARILADMNMDTVCLQTALLHDVVEDTGVTTEEIRKNFGEQVALSVDGVTKLGKLDFYTAEARQAESYRKMFLAMTNDIRVILVKLADRLHNMRTLEYLPAERREAIARETMDIYAPLAESDRSYTFDVGSTLTMSWTAEANPNQVMHGDYKIISGTGAYAGATGKGTFDRVPSQLKNVSVFNVKVAVKTP